MMNTDRLTTNGPRVRGCAAINGLRGRTAGEWVARLLQLPAEIQSGVASIIWWDFADTSAHPRQFTAALEPWLQEGAGRAIPAPRCQAALRALGYPADYAQWRSADRRISWHPGRPLGRPNLSRIHSTRRAA